MSNGKVLKELRDFKYWVGKSPQKIVDTVKFCGGWQRVFPNTSPFPEWAHLVRNYFNENPKKLKLVSNNEVSQGIKFSGFWKSISLDDQVYKDEKDCFWFLMTKGGTSYHYEEYGEGGVWKGIKTSFIPRSQIPVFKLISPDGTGGSNEVIINNRHGKSQIGDFRQWVNVRNEIVKNEAFLGTYNYSETSVVGYSAHEFRDITPHKKTGRYRNPNYLFATRSQRLFMANLLRKDV